MKKFNNVEEYMAAIPRVVAAADNLIKQVESSRIKQLSETQPVDEEVEDPIKKIENL